VAVPRRIVPAQGPRGYPKTTSLRSTFSNCTSSFKKWGDYGGKVGVKVTLENHWDVPPSYEIRIIVVKSSNPFCEARRILNWEHEYLMYTLERFWLLAHH